MTERDRRISDQLVRLVQIVFGLVLAQSFILHKDIVLHPVDNLVPALALATVYITTVLSWIDWHVSMELRPYNFNPKNRYRVTEQLRLGLDMLVVTIYAYLLLSIAEIRTVPNKGVSSYLLGFPAVFATYLLSGLARRRAHGRLATNVTPIVGFGLAYVLLILIYQLIVSRPSMQGTPFVPLINSVAILAALLLMLCYRVTRSKLVRRRGEWKDAGLAVGIDVDGVLANQIHGIVPRVRARLGIHLRYEDVTEWRLRLGDSDIAKEIALALEDPEYVLSMPLHEGARQVVDELYLDNRVVMITGRPTATRSWTAQWLQNAAFTFDELVNVKEEKKSLYRSDVLVDDYIGNIKEYLENTHGVAILVDQPWNRRERGDMEKWLEEGRLHIVGGIREALPIIKGLRRQPTRNGRGSSWRKRIASKLGAVFEHWRLPELENNRDGVKGDPQGLKETRGGKE
jgi:5'(3')-deoxyribonucleotidase